MRLLRFFSLVSFMSCYGGLSVNAQRQEGKISREELELNSYAPDTTAVAFYLDDRGETKLEPAYQMGTTLKRYFRIKILKRAGLTYGNIKVIAARGTFAHLKGATWSLENGVIKKSQLTDKGVFIRQSDRRTDEITIAFPNVKTGSILECSYTLVRENLFLYGWTFQYDIPVQRSEYTMKSPQWGQHEHLRGLQPISEEISKFNGTKKTWVMRNIPAFSEEPLMPDPLVYHSRLIFTRATDTWEMVYKKLREDPTVGALYRYNFLADTTRNILRGISDSLSKIKTISAWVKRKVRWNGISDFRCSDAAKVIKDRQGSSGEINLILVLLLQKAGFNAVAVLLSTRDHGFIAEDVPSAEFFNYAVCQVVVGGREIIMDATDQSLPFDMLPVRCLNHKGFLVGKSFYGWIPIDAPNNTLTGIKATLQIKEDGILQGNMDLIQTGFAAADNRKLSDSVGGSGYCTKLGERHGWTVERVKIDDAFTSCDTVRQALKVSIEGAVEGSAGRIFVNPFFFLKDVSNPFISPQRDFPVDFIFPTERSIECLLTLPAGYRVEVMPANKSFSLADKQTRFSAVMTAEGDQIKISLRIIARKTFFEPEEYPNIREFYSRLAEKCSELITLVRK